MQKKSNNLKDELFSETYNDKDYPPNESYSDILSLFQDVYYVLHQIILTIFVLISDLMSFIKRRFYSNHTDLATKKQTKS